MTLIAVLTADVYKESQANPRGFKGQYLKGR